LINVLLRGRRLGVFGCSSRMKPTSWWRGEGWEPSVPGPNPPKKFRKSRPCAANCSAGKVRWRAERLELRDASADALDARQARDGFGGCLAITLWRGVGPASSDRSIFRCRDKARKSCGFRHRQAGDPAVWARTEAVAIEFRC